MRSTATTAETAAAIARMDVDCVYINSKPLTLL